MSNFTDKFFADKAVGALWDVAVSIKRGNPLPLDKDSVVHGLTELNAIAAGSVSYPGQIIAVVEDAVYEGEGDDKELVKEESVTLYYLDHNKTPREVGKVPTGDSKTIEVSSEGAISLLGSASAQDGTLPLLENGAIVWKTLEDIGAGDGNDNTTYEFSFANEKITVKPLFNGQPIEAEEGEKADAEGNLIVELDLSNFTTSEELAAAIEAVEAKIPTDNKDLANGAGYLVANDLSDYAKSADVVDKTTYATDKKALEDADAALDTAVKAAQKTADDATTAINDFLTGTGAEGVIDSLTEIKKALDDLVDPSELATSIASKADKVENATEGNFAGLDANGNLVDSGKKASDFATAAQGAIAESLDGTVAVLSEEIDGLQAQVQFGSLAQDWTPENSEDVFTVEDAVLAGVEKAESDAAKKYATKEYVGTIPNDAEGNPKAANVVAYIEKKAQEVLDAATGGSSESAASVKQQLDTYKSENDPKVKALLEEVWGSETHTGDSRIDTLETGLADATTTANAAIKDVKAATNAKITVSVGTDKVATVDDAALQTLIGEAKKAGTDANNALETYKGTNDAAVDKVRTDLAAEASKLATLTETVGGHTTKITNLETFQTEHTALYESLNTTVGTHGTDIAGLKTGKADASALEDAVTRISANETAISSRYTKEEANALLADKADKSSVYTKGEADNLLNAKADASAVYTKEEIDSTVGTLATKSELGDQDTALKALITAEETRATGKEAELLAAIQKNAEDIGKIDFVDGTELAAAVKVETDRAVAKEGELAGLIDANSKAIAGNTAAINTIIGGKDIDVDYDSIAELAAWITEHGTEAAGMTKAIEDNAAAIKVINETTIPGAIASANGYTDEAIATLTKTVGDNKTAAEEAIAALTKTVGDNKTAIEGTVSELATLVGNNKTATDAAIKAITDNYKVKDVDGTSLALNADGKASVKAVSTDLLFQGAEELIFCAGDAGKKAE